MHPRRLSPRIEVEAMCWESFGSHEAGAIAVDVSPLGLRVERPYVGGRTVQTVPLQIEIPGIDEVMWARGEACFDSVVPVDGPRGGALGLVRRTGYRIVTAATRDLRMLKEFVLDTYKLQQLVIPD